MPTVLPVSEMQRNGSALVDQAMATKEPIYLTRRGRKAVVLIDADEYDRWADAEARRLRRALEARDAIERGHEQVLNGETVSLESVLGRLEQRWGPTE